MARAVRSKTTKTAGAAGKKPKATRTRAATKPAKADAAEEIKPGAAGRKTAAARRTAAPAGKSAAKTAPRPAARKAAAKTPAQVGPGAAAVKTKAAAGRRPSAKANAEAARSARRAKAARRKQLQQFRSVLEQRHRNLLQSYLTSKGNTRGIGSDGTEDYIDYAVSSYDRDFMLSMTELEREQLVLVEEALARIDRDAYGLCMQCDQEISEKRLEVEPWARHCIRCQELDDLGLLEVRADESEDDLEIDDLDVVADDTPDDDDFTSPPDPDSDEPRDDGDDEDDELSA